MPSSKYTANFSGFIMKFLNLVFVNLLIFCNGAFANGEPKDWQLGFQEAFSPTARAAQETHDFIMLFVWGIVAFVLVLLVVTCVKFRAKNNPTPSTTSHNTLIEIIWIVIPTIILIIIAIPSLKLIYFQETVPESEMTLKVIGRQWYWSYEYPDQGDIAFDSYMKKDEELKAGEPRLLATDNKVYLPTETYIKIQVTSSDVIHAFALPALGVKIDAIPGRLNETWVYIEEPGTYYGQCSELCGILHAFMPIEVIAVPKHEFKYWVERAKEEYSYALPNNMKLANKL